ncbi:MAG: DUF502 domain-containing protein [Minwuia sp.]|uniref:DUF502 domain-containing protein n=1 Tax=Minwuia sp. TaxID=2493630 RepID=UPI003A850371
MSNKSRPDKVLRRRSPFQSRLRNYFLTGVIVTAPIAITIYLTWSFIEWVDEVVIPLVPLAYRPESLLPFSVPGLGVVVAVIGLTLIGALTANLLGRTIVRAGERLVDQMPVIRGIYNVFKQIFETLLKDTSDSFKYAALVEYPRRDLYTIGFVAGDTRGEVVRQTGKNLVSVYVPTTPNPSSGFILFIPREDVLILDMTVEQAMKYVVSVGVVVPPDTKVTPLNEIEKQFEQDAETRRRSA